jgi:PAS domain S-box-containing protein
MHDDYDSLSREELLRRLRVAEASGLETRSEAQQESDAHLHWCLRAASAGTWDWDLRSGEVRWCPQNYRLYQVDPASHPLAYADWLACLHPDDQEKADQAVNEALSGQALEFEIEFRIVHPDGTVLWVLAPGRVIRDSTGEPRRLSGINLDITARKEAEARLQESEQRLDLALDSGQMGMWEWDVEADWSVWNAREYALLGLPPASGHEPTARFFEHIHPEDRSGLERSLSAVRQDPRAEHWSDTFRIVRADGAIRWLAGVGRALRDGDGRLKRMIGVNFDITERKRAEEALRQANRRKDDFLATLGHELRNPLAPIRNACELLKLKGPADPAVQSAGDMIERQVSHLVRLVDDLLEASRITRGKLALRRESLELSSAIEQAVELARFAIDEAGHGLSVSLPAEPIRLEADPVRLAQLFANLLTNACRYTPSGGRIRLAATAEGSEARVEVIDTGIGIPEAYLPHVFDMFYQVPAGARQPSPGLGIGLSLVRGLAELHGGRVSAQSAGPGAGTTFTVHLPMQSLDAAPPPPRKAAAEPPPRLGGRVLVADDHVDVADSLALLLRLRGLEVESVYDGQAAVAAVERFRPDLVLMDVGMPRLDGLEACRQIRAQPSGRGLRIVAISGYGQDRDRQHTAEAGFDAHWVKPVAPSAVLELLATGRIC